MIVTPPEKKSRDVEVDGVTYGNGSTDSLMTCEYNLGGALIEQQYPSGRRVKNVLDNNGDLSLVQSKKNESHAYWNYSNRFTYNAAGAVTSMQLGNGTWESTTFNSRLQPTQIALGATQGTTNLLDLDYTYDTTANNGNVLSQTITVPTVGANTGFTAVQTYNYDSLNRIKDATESITPHGGSQLQSWKQTFLFDRYGNRNFDEANTTFEGFDKLCNGNTELCADLRKKLNPAINTSDNRLSSGQGYSFDDAGNTTRDASDRKFTYDAENKQVKVESLIPGTNTVTGTIGEYFYDGDGRRVKKYVPSTGEVTIFVYDAASKLIAEYSTIVASQQDAKVAYLTGDHLGSPRINTDAHGGVTARHDYHPFGEEIATSQRTGGLGYMEDSVKKQFTGYERDVETELDFAEARFYSSRHGRFTSVDPEGPDLNNPQTFSKYRYALNNPLRYNDKDGRYEDDVHRDLTRALAFAAGFSMDDASRIANGNQDVDDNPDTSPMEIWRPVKGWDQRRKHHFTTAEQREQLWNEFTLADTVTDFLVDLDFTDAAGATRDVALGRLGTYLHAQQDSYSHAGFNAVWGQLFAGHEPDYTSTNVGRADNMALDSFTRLKDAAGMVSGTSAAIPYSVIKDRVNEFNAAKTREEKNEIIKKIEADIKAIRDQRSLQKAKRGED